MRPRTLVAALLRALPLQPGRRLVPAAAGVHRLHQGFCLGEAASSGSNQTDDAGNRELAVQDTRQSRKTPVSIGYYRWSTIRFDVPSYPVLLHTTPPHSHSILSTQRNALI